MSVIKFLNTFEYVCCNNINSGNLAVLLTVKTINGRLGLGLNNNLDEWTFNLRQLFITHK